MMRLVEGVCVGGLFACAHILKTIADTCAFCLVVT